MKDEPSLDAGNYATLNQYLTGGRYSNEQLYDYLLSCRNELAFSHHMYQQPPLHLSPDMIKNFQFPSPDYRNQPVSADQFDILKRTEQHIFAQVLALSSQIAALQAELNRSSVEAEQRNQKIAGMHANFDDQLCQKAQKEVQLTIEFEKVNGVKAQTQEIQSKIELTLLLDEDLEGLTLQAQMSSLRIKQEIERARGQMDGSISVKAKAELQAEVQNLRQKVSGMKNKQEQGDNVREDELLECLRERKTLQQELLHQQLEKGQFFQLLNHFKTNFKKVKERNKLLKQQLAKKGLSMPKANNIQKQQIS